MISQKTIQEVINISRVEEVVGDFINLRRRGVNLIGNCPFHDEKTPSFIVSPSKNIYKCFGCGKGGDPVRFIIDHEKMSFPEAIRFLAEKYRIAIEETENSEADILSRQLTDSLYILNEFARDQFTSNLFEREEGRAIGLSYFKERGLREATIRQFQLGYALDSKDQLTLKAVEKKYNIEHLRLLGLTTRSDIDFFRARVMFPIHNVSGKVVAFAGRTLSSDKKVPKYINSPESEIYSKRTLLYGLFFAKDSIRKEDECILVEGYTDVISLHQGNIKNVVASSGTSLTKEQIRLIKRYTQNIKIIYDGDPAGIKAALRGLDLVLESDMNVKLVLLPEGHDPDSFLSEKGTSAFNDYLKGNEEDFVFFKTRVLLNESGQDPIRKAAVIRDIVSSIARVQDSFKRALYIRQCSHMLDMNEQLLVQETAKVIKGLIKENKEFRSATSPEVPEEMTQLQVEDHAGLPERSVGYASKDSWQERAVCSVLINFGHKIYDEDARVYLAHYIIQNSKELLPYFDMELCKKIIDFVSETLEQGIIPEPGWYVGHEDDEIRQFAVDALATPYTYASWEKKEMFLQTQKMPEENYVRDAENALQRLRLKKNNRVIASLQEYFEKATEAEKESEEFEINFKVLQLLIQQRNTLATQLGTVTL
jgi:DNA primase